MSDGGLRPVPLCEPWLTGSEASEAAACVASGWVSSASPYVARFERVVGQYLGNVHAVATQSGTAALHTGLALAGVGPGDEVLVSALSFVAPANAIRYLGAVPVFLDAEPAHWQLDPDAVAGFLERECVLDEDGTRNRETGRRVRAVVPVHLLGHPVDLDPILALADRHRLAVVEDAAEALGARYRGTPVGCLGDAACLSFNGNKSITTGGGGMVVTPNDDWAHRARYLTTQARKDPLESIHGEVGFNYRLGGVPAAIGCAQMERIDEILARKRSIARAYARGLRDVPGVEVQPVADWATSSHWLTTVRIREEVFGCSSRQAAAALREQGIETRPLWQPLHRSPAHAGSPRTECPVADRLAREALSLPSSAGITAREIARVVGALRALAPV